MSNVHWYRGHRLARARSVAKIDPCTPQTWRTVGGSNCINHGVVSAWRPARRWTLAECVQLQQSGAAVVVLPGCQVVRLAAADRGQELLEREWEVCLRRFVSVMSRAPVFAHDFGSIAQRCTQHFTVDAPSPLHAL